MKTKIGKKYIDASGDIVKIVRKSENIDYDFVDDKCVYFTKDGYFYFSKIKSEYDLICEVNDLILHRYENEFITKYQFLMEHYILYGGSLKCLTNHKINMN